MKYSVVARSSMGGFIRPVDIDVPHAPHDIIKASWSVSASSALGGPYPARQDHVRGTFKDGWFHPQPSTLDVGHGWVYPLKGGHIAKCLGPKGCSECGAHLLHALGLDLADILAQYPELSSSTLEADLTLIRESGVEHNYLDAFLESAT